MPIHCSEELKVLRDASVGELIGFEDHPHRYFALVLAVENNSALVGTLVPGDEPHPRIRNLSMNDACVSYGTDWLIEPEDTSNQALAPSQGGIGRRCGLLVRSTDGWFMNFATSGVDYGGRVAWSWYNLETGADARGLGEPLIIFPNWRVWRNAADRDHARGVPLVEFHAAEAPPRRG